MGDEARSLGVLRAELEILEWEERQLSLLRRRLHEQIDRGFPNDLQLARERRVSTQRRRLHRLIGILRARLESHDGTRPSGAS